MLRKLLKHEFRATGRIMLPLFGILLLVSVGANFSSRGMLNSDSSLLRTLGTIFIMLFIVVIFAVGIISFVLMINRFYKNLLQDEGYVMMTLPVCVHQQIWSKLIVSTVWFAATVVVIGLSCCIMAFDIRFVGDLWHGFLNLLDYAVRINHLDLWPTARPSPWNCCFCAYWAPSACVCAFIRPCPSASVFPITRGF